MLRISDENNICDGISVIYPVCVCARRFSKAALKRIIIFDLKQPVIRALRIMIRVLEIFN